MKVNGAAARLVHRGDTIIVISYAQYDEADLERYEPRVVHVETGHQPHHRRRRGGGDPPHVEGVNRQSEGGNRMSTMRNITARPTPRACR